MRCMPRHYGRETKNCSVFLYIIIFILLYEPLVTRFTIMSGLKNKVTNQKTESVKTKRDKRIKMTIGEKYESKK